MNNVEIRKENEYHASFVAMGPHEISVHCVMPEGVTPSQAL